MTVYMPDGSRKEKMTENKKTEKEGMVNNMSYRFKNKNWS